MAKLAPRPQSQPKTLPPSTRGVIAISLLPSCRFCMTLTLVTLNLVQGPLSRLAVRVTEMDAETSDATAMLGTSHKAALSMTNARPFITSL